ncbi:hypothetical protein ElyMa_000598700 [Elysia marginata]|uniref:ZP domain-containing protein n=1 Tax=Elysia marginata TaxID=1093978 RepID=A0AAV4G6F6_9GAST|nr:hypothetical protein ElyMa_000598700 [Elysia marginata]
MSVCSSGTTRNISRSSEASSSGTTRNISRSSEASSSGTTRNISRSQGEWMGSRKFQFGEKIPPKHILFNVLQMRTPPRNQLYLDLNLMSFTLFSLCIFQLIELGLAQKSNNFSITFNGKYNTAFINSPVQGTCTSVLESDEKLTLQVSRYSTTGVDLVVGKYVLQNGLITAERKTKDMVVQKLPESWFYRGAAGRIGMVFKYCVREKVRMDCRAHKHSGLKNRGRNVNSLYRPLKPFLVVYYHLQPNTLLVGKYFKMTCSAYVGTNGKLSFIIPARKGGKIHHWTVHSNRARDHEEPSGEPGKLKFKTELTDKGPKIQASLVLFVWATLAYEKIACQSSNMANTLQETIWNNKSALSVVVVVAVVVIVVVTVLVLLLVVVVVVAVTVVVVVVVVVIALVVGIERQINI